MIRRSVVLIDPYCDGHHLSYAITLATGLSERGIDVSAIGGKGFVDGLEKEVKLTNSHVISPPTKNGILGAIQKTKFLFFSLMYVRRYKPSCIHLLQLDTFMGALLFLLAFSNQKKIFATLHWGYFIDQYIPKRFLNRLKARIQRRTLRKLVDRGVSVMVHSQTLQQVLNQFMRNPTIAYVPYPVAITAMSGDRDLILRGARLRSELEIPHDAFLLLCFGGTAFYKGVDIAICALSYLPENVYLLVAGKEEHFTKKMIDDLSGESGVSERVKVYAKYIPDEQVANYFSAANIALIPYRNPFSGQSGPLTIAAFLGISVVASNSPVLEEYVEKYSLGAIFQAGDAKSLAAAVSSVLGSGSRPDIERFREDHCASRFCQSVIDYYDNQANYLGVHNQV